MTEFKADCTINLHLEARGKPAKIAWACSITHPKHGHLVIARKFLGLVEREEAELESLLFGLRQAARFLQEKVEVNATFPLEGKLREPNTSSRAGIPALRPKREDVVKLWNAFRLRRAARMTGPEAELLRKEAELAFQRKN
jgi:hypothetical protein